MNNIKLLPFMLLVFIVFKGKSQKIANISSELIGDKIIITYDLDDKNKGAVYTVKIKASIDDKASKKLQSVEGDVGKNVESGKDKKIVWYYQNDTEKIGSIQFFITAEQTNHPYFRGMFIGYAGWVNTPIGFRIGYMKNFRGYFGFKLGEFNAYDKEEYTQLTNNQKVIVRDSEYKQTSYSILSGVMKRLYENEKERVYLYIGLGYGQEAFIERYYEYTSEQTDGYRGDKRLLPNSLFLDTGLMYNSKRLYFSLGVYSLIALDIFKGYNPAILYRDVYKAPIQLPIGIGFTF